MDKTPNWSANWQDAAHAFLKPSAIRMLFLGFSAGIPILLIFSSLSLWLREAGVERSAVTFFSWAALGYSFKFIWAPLIDQLPIPFLAHTLGRRRSWLLIAQFTIMAAITWMAFSNPATGLVQMALAAVMLGFASATQDIVIDAYRIESDNTDMQAILSSTYIAGYRIGMLVAGAGALYLADFFGSSMETYHYGAWQWTYLIMAATMLVGVITTLIIPEPKLPPSAETNKLNRLTGFLTLFIDPVKDFFSRYGLSTALLLLALIGFYRVSDIVLGVISNVFYQDLGFTKTEIATVVKTYGLFMTIAGGFLGGFLAVRFKVLNILLLGAVLSAITNLLFVGLSLVGNEIVMLYIVIAADNLAAGLASAAFVAFLSSLTNVSFTAMQYAIFSSFMTLLPKLIGGYSGTLVDSIGYSQFFILTTVIGLPVLALVWAANKKLLQP